ncbi:hypothetical protein BGX30_001539, partial [Mortierella sp. GBA39]
PPIGTLGPRNTDADERHRVRIHIPDHRPARTPRPLLLPRCFPRHDLYRIHGSQQVAPRKEEVPTGEGTARSRSTTAAAL